MNKSLVTAVLTSLLSSAGVAQELRLFEESQSAATEEFTAATPQRAAAQGNGQPAFTLRSLSRFGDRYQATLVDRAGQTSRLDWTAGETTPVQNSGGFTVVAAGSTSLSLQHPPGDSCISAELVGVFCAANNRSELRLAVAAPLASNGAQPTMSDAERFGGPAPMGPAAAVNVDPAQNGQRVYINPFTGQPETMPQNSAEQGNSRQELRAMRLRQLEQQRINDADIPPGMQRVRTPFGDRLMPIRE